MNRTILERVRFMLLESRTLKKFWGEAANTTCILIYKCPSSAIDFKTPYERWYVTASGYDYLWVFGCRAYTHVKQVKLESRATKCVLIGYPEGVKGYKLWCTEAGNQKVIVSRDVIFKEEEMPYLKQGKGDEDTRKRSDSTRLEAESNGKDQGSDDQNTEHTSSDKEDDNDSNDLRNYLLARDRTRRHITPSRRI